MMQDEKIQFKNIYRKIQSCWEIEDKVVITFLSYIFEELSLRNNQLKYEVITCDCLYSLYDLPVWIVDKLFALFDVNRHGKLSKIEFVKGMFNLLFSDFDTIKISVFKIFEFGNNNKIYIEDVRLILFYLNTNTDLFIKNMDKYILDFFDSRIFLTKEEFYNNIENQNSDIFVIFLILLNYKLLNIFDAENLNFFRTYYIESNTDDLYINYERNISFIKKPNPEINFYFKFVGNFNRSTVRKYGSKNILDFSNNIDEEFTKDNTYDYDNSTKQINSDKKSSINLNLVSQNLFKNNFSTNFCYQLYKENRLDKIKLIISEKFIFLFKYIRNQNEYFLNRLIPLHGYQINLLKMTKINEKDVWPCILELKFNFDKNLQNIFIFKTEKECLNFYNEIRIKMEIKLIQNYYKILHKIGEGQHAKVVLGEDLITAEKVAIKIIKKTNYKEKYIKNLLIEIDIMKYLKFNHNENIVKIINSFEDRNHIYFVMEFIKGGSLSQYLHKKGKILKVFKIKFIVNQIAKGLDFLHKNGIVHRDIKTDNIILSENKVIIIDFGVSIILSQNDKTNEKIGTLVYSAPEVIIKTPYNYKVDIWSFGVLIYYLLIGEYPFDEDGEATMEEISNKICKKELTFPDRIPLDKELKSLIRSCLQKSSSKRIEIKQILKFYLEL